MSAPSETPVEKLEITGSCHCGAIKYVAHNVDLNKVGKCNCTICTATGRLGIRLTPGDITITNTPSGEPTVIRYANSTDVSLWPAELTYYSPAFHRGDAEKGKEPARHFFCKTCSINLFIIGNIPFRDIGEIVGLNGLTLDLKSVGKNLKDLTKPSNLTYLSGRDNTFVMSPGEPHDHGSW
ncbi:hypothetical protein H072_4694 [Dactylellina haptotyla CBS 200.50]|uniref:CENP-V/GFA domain-containing protein n=1 Tax=Dactylellina haptotyla (strain CBS 200.50) TaxID=1284197 RepID=S8AJV8_DACHA|nr:hypothetical protein H072_4694 [Dactylellina haptotyla CBS 200.50]